MPNYTFDYLSWRRRRRFWRTKHKMDVALAPSYDVTNGCFMLCCDLWLDDCLSINVGLSTIQTNATRRTEWVYYSNKLAVQCDFREFDGSPISLGYTTIHWTFGLGAHTVKFCLWRSRFALHIVKQYFAECGLQNAEFEQRIICGTFRIKISANYTLLEFRIPQNTPTHQLFDSR